METLYRRMAEVLEALVLPPRAPSGSEENIRRVGLTAAALHQWKASRLTPKGRRRHRQNCSTCKVRLRWKGGKAPWRLTRTQHLAPST